MNFTVDGWSFFVPTPQYIYDAHGLVAFRYNNHVIKITEVHHVSILSQKSFESVINALDIRIAHPDMSQFQPDMAAAIDFAELERVVAKAVGEFGFMEFARFNMGMVLRKESGQDQPKIVRLLIGNPLVMKEMAKYVPEAAAYAPVTVLIDERSNGVHLSYDRMASFLARYNNPKALKVAQSLDAKIESLMKEVADNAE